MPTLGPQKVARLWEKLGRRCDLGTAAGREALLAAMPPAARKVWEPVSAVVAGYCENRAKTGAKGVPLLVSGFVDAFYRGYLQKSFENPEDRIDDLSEVGVQIADGSSVAEFLQSVALNTNAETEVGRSEGKDKNAVRLSTVHQAKGLEWPVVFIISVNEDMFPAKRALEENGDDSEERRLFYVAVTRAKKNLAIFVPNMRKSFEGGSFPCKPSRFIREIPQNLMTTRFGVYR